MPQIYATLPIFVKKLSPTTMVIIDCTEMFVQTPSFLEVQSLLWSEYKHHCTFQLLIWGCWKSSCKSLVNCSTALFTYLDYVYVLWEKYQNLTIYFKETRTWLWTFFFWVKFLLCNTVFCSGRSFVKWQMVLLVAAKGNEMSLKVTR